MKRTLDIILIAVVVVALAAQCGRKKTPVNIRISGSTTIEPLIRDAVREYNARGNVTFSVSATCSRSGFDSLVAGSCDIAMSSMEVPSEVVAQAEKNGVSIKSFMIGYDAIVPIVHPSNGLSDVSFDRLGEIYNGTILRWSQLGGIDTAIEVVERVDGSGTFSVWHHDVKVPGVRPQGVVELSTSSAVTAYVASHPAAIGYVSVPWINPEVKPLSIDGVGITAEDLSIRKYRLRRPLYLYVNQKRFGSEARSFIIFLMVNRRGHELMRKSGFFPVTTDLAKPEGE